jgi:hypothetical protein
MTVRRLVLASVLSVLFVGGLLWGDSAAVVTTVKSTKTILVKGMVNTNGEPVPFSGNIQIKTTFVPDPDFGLTPIVIVSIDMLDVQGLGQTTKTKYFAIEEDKLNRLFKTTPDTFDLTFAISTDPNGDAIVGTGLVSLTLTYDGAGNLVDASGSVNNNPFSPNV